MILRDGVGGGGGRKGGGGVGGGGGGGGGALVTYELSPLPTGLTTNFFVFMFSKVCEMPRFE